MSRESGWGAAVLAAAVVAALCALGAAPAIPAPPPELRFAFIGNMAFHVTDGRTVLLTDFPYESGAFGYMQWEPRDVPPVKDGLALITHSHRDHFAPELLPAYDVTVAGAPEVRALVKTRPTLALDPPLRFRDLAIEPRPTPHAGREHYSYLVTWHGLRFYLSGDTEDPADLLAARDLDLAFVSPWLYGSVRKRGARIDARRVVIYHHEGEERVPGDAGERTVPRPGEVLSLRGR